MWSVWGSGSPPAPHGLRPRDAAVGLEDPGADVRFIAPELVDRRTGRHLGEHLPVPADELHAILARRRLFDGNRDRFGRYLIVRQLHAGRRIEVAAFESLDDRSGLQFLGADEDPATPRSRH